MTGIRELGRTVSAAPEHVRVSVLGGCTQLDVALPMDVPVATLVPELVRLVHSRDVKTSIDTPWAATRDTFCVLRRLDPPAPLAANETLRAAGVMDGELLQLTDQRALFAPTLYDDVVDAAARLNKAAHAGWDAAAAHWMSFMGLAVASLVWVCLLVDVTLRAQRALMVGLAMLVAATMVGVATLAHRFYGRADVGTAMGWSAIPISAAIVWELARSFGDYGAPAGCALLVAVDAACYRMIGTGRWGYLASGVLFAGGGMALLGHALAVSTRTVGAICAVAGALACLMVPRLVGRLAPADAPTSKPEPDRAVAMFESPFTPQLAAPDSGAKAPTPGAIPTAEAVWARVREAAVTRSALYAGLAANVFCGVVAVVRSGSGMHWAALFFAGSCAAVLGVYARLPDSAAERMSLGVPAAALVVVGCVGAQDGGVAMVRAGFGTLFAIAVLASLAGVGATLGILPRRGANAWAYLQYAAYAALIPVALWVTGVYAQLRIR